MVRKTGILQNDYTPSNFVRFAIPSCTTQIITSEDSDIFTQNIALEKQELEVFMDN